MQEELGPDIAKKLLITLDYSDEFITNVMFLIAHHHTYDNIKSIEHQILVEADFLVNLYEDAVPVSGIHAAYHNIFKTKTGKHLCQTMFASAFPQ